MAISYEEALATLQSMFSDQGYTSQQLDAVLRHHGGHMENTVESLLTHGGTPDELMAKLPSLPAGGAASNAEGGGGGSTFDADEELARQLQAEATNRGGGRSMTGGGLRNVWGGAAASTVTAPSRSKPKTNPAAVAAPTPPAGTKWRGTPTVLPADFLRIPGRKYPNASSSSPAAAAAAGAASNHNGVTDPIASAAGPGAMGQMMSDEQMARMLQDELFQEELRNNPEFSHLAGRRNPSQRQATGRSTYSGGGGGAASSRQQGGADFFDRMAELGDNAKSRFQAFAERWNDNNAQPNQPKRGLFGVGGGNAAPATAAAQTNANRGGNERTGLLSNDLDMDEEEEEMDFVGSGGAGGRDFEMNAVGGSYDKKKD